MISISVLLVLLTVAAHVAPSLVRIRHSLFAFVLCLPTQFDIVVIILSIIININTFVFNCKGGRKRRLAFTFDQLSNAYRFFRPKLPNTKAL